MFLLFAACTAFYYWSSHEVQASLGVQAQVTGTVTDINGSRVANADAEFQREGKVYRARTGATGTYSIELPPGIYAMEIERYGFCRLRRGKFLLKPGTSVHFDTQLHVCPSDSPTSRYFYEELDRVPNSPVRPLILFGDKAPAGGMSWRYTGPWLVAMGTDPVFFTYNVLTVTADSLVYDAKEQTVVASGHVCFQDGNSTKKGSRVEITLNGLYPSGRLTE